MEYQITALAGSGSEIVQRVIEAGKSQLLVPPKLRPNSLNIGEPEADEKYIGLFSSGTTGKPKAIWNSMPNLKRNAQHTAEAFGIGPEDRLLIIAAPWHVAGLSWAIMAEDLGCEYDFITSKKGESDRWLQEIRRVDPDVLLTVPGVVSAVLDQEWSVSKMIFGGYSPHEKEFEKYARHAEQMIQGYGQTEAGGLISCHTISKNGKTFPNEYICCGYPIKGVEIFCKGKVDHSAPIWIRSETAFTPKKYKAGDLGYKDDAGRLFISGRVAEIISQK